MKVFRDERVMQVIVAVAILLGVLVVTIAIRLAGAAPGLLGEWFGMIAGFLSTPVLLEVSFFTIGLMIVVGVNHWRMKREGEEFVEFEELGPPVRSPVGSGQGLADEHSTDGGPTDQSNRSD